uniref:Si:dkey-32e6.3 n=1 Tax=Neogobius melanostomus TaxID=47308 RepID=A0A8C6WHF1_9GOBI
MFAERSPASLWPGSEERVPVSSRSSPPVSSRRRLVLHIDLNNTVLVSDSVTGLGTEAALDGFLPGVTWGRVHKGQWEWLNAVSYFSQFGRTAAFTSSSTGRPSLCPQPDTDLSVRGEDGRLYHWLLPSFFQLLIDLTSEGVDFAVVFRTFGTDLPRVLRAVSRVLREGHPLFHKLPQMFVDETPGKIRCSQKGVVLSRGPERVTSAGDDGARRLYSCLSAAHGIQGFRDHFDWWAGHSFSLAGGKPLWIDPFDPEVQHIFIDDNIRLSDQDTIVHPMVFSAPGSSIARSASSSELYDVALVQTDLLQAIADPHYFTRKVHECEDNYRHNLLHEVSATDLVTRAASLCSV